MSRSAEIRQMMIQQRVAEERKMLMATGELVDPDVYVEREGEVVLSGNERTFNINTMLAENIRDSDYFNRKCLRLREFEDIIQEAFDKLDHVEPWSAGTSRHPSTAFSLLMRLFVYRLTHSELNILLTNKRSPHVRALGFLYIRYGLFRDSHLWDWLAPYVDDPEEFSPGVDGKKITMGAFVRILLDEPKYYGTLLPRIPVPTMRKIRAKLLDLNNTDKRELKNARYASLMVPGTRVEAMYQVDRQWYPAVVQRVLAGRKIEVNFVEYDELATVPFGAIRIPADVRKELQRAKSREREREEEEREPSPRGDGPPPAKRAPSPGGHSREARGRGSPPHGRSRSRDRASLRRRRSRSRSRDRDRGSSRHRSRSRHRDDRSDRGERGGSSSRRRRDSRSRSGRRHRGSSRSRRRSRSRSPRGSRGGRGRERGRERSPVRGTARRDSPLDDGYSDEEEDIETLVRQREREAAAASGKDYAQRPTTLKGAIQMDSGNRSMRSRSPSPSQQVVPRKRAQEPRASDGAGAGAGGAGSEAAAAHNGEGNGHGAASTAQKPQPPQAPADTEARRRLVAMYGDVSGESEDRPTGHSLYEGSEVLRVGTRKA